MLAGVKLPFPLEDCSMPAAQVMLRLLLQQARVTPQKRQLEQDSLGQQVQEKALGGTKVRDAGEVRRLTTPCSVEKCILRESRVCRSRGDLHAMHLKPSLGSDRII